MQNIEFFKAYNALYVPREYFVAKCVLVNVIAIFTIT